MCNAYMLYAGSAKIIKFHLFQAAPVIVYRPVVLVATSSNSTEALTLSVYHDHRHKQTVHGSSSLPSPPLTHVSSHCEALCGMRTQRTTWCLMFQLCVTRKQAPAIICKRILHATYRIVYEQCHAAVRIICTSYACGSYSLSRCCASFANDVLPHVLVANDTQRRRRRRWLLRPSSYGMVL